jgi:hypothetical protein
LKRRPRPPGSPLTPVRAFPDRYSRAMAACCTAQKRRSAPVPALVIDAAFNLDKIGRLLI